MTDRLDRIEQSIESSNTAVNMILTEFIRPLAQQSVVNQNALDGLIQMRADAEIERIEQNQRIENLLDEARADRQQATADREENRRRFDAQQQISQAMLVELARVNSRLEILERAS